MMKNKINLSDQVSKFNNFKLFFLGLGVILILVLITIVFTTSLDSGIIKLFLIYMFGFIGGGWLIALIFNKFLDKKIIQEEENLW